MEISRGRSGGPDGVPELSSGRARERTANSETRLIRPEHERRQPPSAVHYTRHQRYL